MVAGVSISLVVLVVLAVLVAPGPLRFAIGAVVLLLAITAVAVYGEGRYECTADCTALHDALTLSLTVLAIILAALLLIGLAAGAARVLRRS